MSSMTVDDDADPAGALLATIDAAVTELLATDPTGRSITAHKHVLIRTQQLINRLPALQHRELAALRHQASPADWGDTLPRALADLLRITRAHAKKLLADTDNLGPRVSLSGEPMPAWLAQTAAAQAEGAITAEHVAVIRDFLAVGCGSERASVR
jgi:hypothetical protein